MAEENLIEALRGGETPDTLKEKFAIRYRRHWRYNHLISFSYNQIDSPMHLGICQEARGIVLDEGRNWRPVARAFKKFFNLGETNAADIDWASARVEPKLDGSMVCMWRYNGEVELSTTGTPDAVAAIVDGVSGDSFRCRFERTLRDVYGLYLSQLSAYIEDGLTYIFEYMSAADPIVVQHKQDRICLIGRRWAVSGEWLPTIKPGWLGDVECIQALDILPTADSVRAAASMLDGMQEEGFVVVDKNYDRVKVKSPDYLAKHKLRFSFTKKSLIEVVKDNEIDEILSVFPSLEPKIMPIKAMFWSMINEADAAYRTIRDTINPNSGRSEYAAMAKQYNKSITALLFEIYDKNVPAYECVKRKDIEKIERLLDGYERDYLKRM